MKKNIRIVLAIAFLLNLSAGAYSQPAGTTTGVAVQRLTCEYLTNPLGIDAPNPRISWNIVTEKRNWRQLAYQVVVSSDEALLKKDIGDLWNSRKIISNESIQVRYGGKPLTSFTNCYWKVRVWDQHGQVSQWSEPAYWKMGVLSPHDWKGEWVCSDLRLTDYQVALRALPDFDMGSESKLWKTADSIRKHVQIPDTAPAVYLRKAFTLHKTIKRATVYACGLGLYELYMNGRRVGKDYLNPAYTDYQKRVLYNTYDVTDDVKKGGNAVGVILANGWYNLIVPHSLRYYAADYIDPPKLLLQLYIEYADGSKERIVTDTTWKFTTHGPIVYNDILSGETYNALNEMPGWDSDGFSDTAWSACGPAKAPQGALRTQLLDPVRKLDSFPAVQVEKTEKGYRFDMGRYLCGWVGIRLKGTKGQKVKVSYPGASSHTLGRYQTSYFILRGREGETFEPDFCYNGFRYIEVEGIDYTPSLSDVKAFLVATDLKRVGDFSCSNEKLNQVQEILINTIRNYIIHIPNDPTREKTGWTQDIENGFDVNAYNFSVARMYSEWQDDFNDIVHSNGYVPPVVPGRFDGPTINGPWWGGMIIYNVGKLYEYYHDEEIVKNSFESMKKYMGYLTSISDHHIITWGLGDWMEPSQGEHDHRPVSTPVKLTSTLAYYYYAHEMAGFAALLHKTADAQYFRELAGGIKQSYNDTFLNAQTGQYAKGSQASQLMSLYFGLAPEDKRELIIQKLREAIQKSNGNLSTGFVATPMLLTTLSDLGLSGEAYTMATKNDFPGWYDMLFNKGNSVMKETWRGGLVQMPSLGGPIGYWFFSSLAGIKPALPAFQRIEIKPDFLDSLSWVSARVRCSYGEIVSKWKREGNRYRIDVEIPANTTATIYLPAGDPDEVMEGNEKIKARRDMSIEKITGREMVVKIGSGRYSFVVGR